MVGFFGKVLIWVPSYGRENEKKFLHPLASWELNHMTIFKLNYLPKSHF